VSKKEKAVSIIKRLRDKGFEAYLAGGCVRDYLLGSLPQDYDITTDARPEVIEKIFTQTVAVGKQFGVILVVIDGEPFEVATFRQEFHSLLGSPFSQNTGGLFTDSFPGDLVDHRCLLLDGPKSILFNRKIKAGRKPNSSYHPQTILSKSLTGISYGTDQPSA